MKLLIPEYARWCISVLENAGFETWAVGGFVRDSLLGIPSNDVDLASSASPEEIKALFPKVFDTGIKHGTVTVVTGDHNIEITQFRCEGSYSDSRHPDCVTPVKSIDEDLSRRDFTINALAYSETRGLRDLFNGSGDLKEGLVRCVGNPRQRFSEDALRIMRAFRFASKLGFDVEKETREAAISMADSLKFVSSERIYKELYLTLCGRKPELAEQLICSGGLKRFGLDHINGSFFPINNVPRDEGCLVAALSYLCGADVFALCRELKTSRRTREDACSCANEIITDIPGDSYEIKRGLNRAGNRYILCLKTCGALTEISVEDMCFEAERILQSGEPFSVSMLAVCGNDLESAGLRGRAVGIALNRLLDKVMRDPSLNTREKLLQIV